MQIRPLLFWLTVFSSFSNCNHQLWKHPSLRTQNSKLLQSMTAFTAHSWAPWSSDLRRNLWTKSPSSNKQGFRTDVLDIIRDLRFLSFAILEGTTFLLNGKTVGPRELRPKRLDLLGERLRLTSLASLSFMTGVNRLTPPTWWQLILAPAELKTLVVC